MLKVCQFYLFKKSTLSFVGLFYCFSGVTTIYFCFDLCYFLSSFYLGLSIFLFLVTWGKGRLLVCKFYFLFVLVNLPASIMMQTASCKFWYFVFPISFVLRYFLISHLIYIFFDQWLFRVFCLISICLWSFQLSSCYWYLISCLSGQKRYLVWIQSPFICWGLFPDLTYVVCWRIICAHLKRMCSLLLLEGMFYIFGRSI